MADAPKMEPVPGWWVDDDGEEHPDEWFFIPGWEVAKESVEGVTIQRRRVQQFDGSNAQRGEET